MKAWPTKKIGDKNILTMSSGGTPSRGDSSYYNGNIIWLKSGELNDNQNINNSEEKISELAIKNSSAKIFPENTVLLAMYGATAGKLGILSAPAATNQAVAGMICKENVLYHRYLYYFLLVIREKMISRAWGGAQPNLSQTIIKDFEIPFPPLETQKKIVTKIEELFAKISQAQSLHESAIQDTNTLLESTLCEIFSGAKSKGWKDRELGELCDLNPRNDSKTLSNDTEVSFIPMKYVDDIEGIVKQADIRKLGAVKKGYTSFKDNDVLFAKITPCMENGKAVHVYGLKNGIGFGSTEFHIIRSKGDILPKLVYYYIRRKSYREEAEKRMTGSAGQKRVPKEFIEKSTILLPPLSEQKKIVGKMDALTQKVRELQQLQSETAANLTALKQSILHKAFQGELIN